MPLYHGELWHQGGINMQQFNIFEWTEILPWNAVIGEDVEGPNRVNCKLCVPSLARNTSITMHENQTSGLTPKQGVQLVLDACS